VLPQDNNVMLFTGDAIEHAITKYQLEYIMVGEVSDLANELEISEY